MPKGKGWYQKNITIRPSVPTSLTGPQNSCVVFRPLGFLVKCAKINENRVIDLKVKAEFIHVGFLDLLCDAIYHYRESLESKDSYVVNRSARASITASFLSLECCANALLQSLELPKSLYDDYERLSAISKIETYLNFTNSEKSIERSDNRVQKIKELIKVRNQFVHPKSTKINTEIGEPQDRKDIWMIPMSLEGVHHKGINIPKSALFWSSENALSVLVVIFDFFDYLFTSLTPLHDIKRATLLNRVVIGNVVVPNTFSEFDSELSKAKEFGLKTDWILKRVSN